MVEADGLRFAYGRRQALDGVTLQVEAGEIYAVLGPNGAGKSTLFQMLSTLVAPQEGRLAVLGHSLPAGRSRVRPHLGVVFQSPSLDPLLSVDENLRCHGHLFGLRGRELERQIERQLERFELAHRGTDRVAQLSGGLQRRVELAKTLLPEPRLLLLDEPSSGLDPGARRDLWDLLDGLRHTGEVSVVLSTHFMEEAERCDRLALIDAGRIVAAGAPGDLVSEIGGEVVMVRTAEPQELLEAARQRLGVEGAVVDGRLRFELPDGHRLVTRLAEAFPGALDEVRLARPTLEDVFLHRTGHRFSDSTRGPEA